MKMGKWICAVLMVLGSTGCQVATVVDENYADTFSIMDSPADKIIKLDEVNEYDDAALVYDQHKATITDPEEVQALAQIKNKIRKTYRKVSSELDDVGAPGRYTAVESSLAEAKSIRADYDSFATSLGLNELVEDFSEKVRTSTLKHNQLVEKEVEAFLYTGDLPSYVTTNTLKGFEGGKYNDARKSALSMCRSLDPKNSIINTAYRCLSLDAEIRVNKSNDSISETGESFWSAIKAIKKNGPTFNIDVGQLSELDITALLLFYGIELDLIEKQEGQSAKDLIPQNRNQVFTVTERASIEESSEAREQSSSYLLRTDRLPNRQYQEARRKYQETLQQKQNCLNNYYAQAASNPYAINLCGMWAIPIASARNNLSSTPQYVKNKVYEDYSFNITEAEVSVQWRVTVSALDQKDVPQALTFTKSESDTFKFAEGLSPKDRRFKKYRFDTDEDVSDLIDQAPDIDFKTVLKRIETAKRMQLASIEDLTDGTETGLSVQSPSIAEETPIDDQILSDSIVIVSTRKGTGTGFYVGTSFILTNEHVVEKSPTVQVTNRKNQSFTAVVLAKDKSKDLALLVVTEMPGEALTLSNERPNTGEEVRAYGHPSGYEFSVTRGIVSAFRNVELPGSVTGAKAKYVQSDVAISPGNSGGPLIQDGKVVGVITFKDALQGSEGLSFSLSSVEVLEWINSRDIDGL